MRSLAVGYLGGDDVKSAVMEGGVNTDGPRLARWPGRGEVGLGEKARSDDTMRCGAVRCGRALRCDPRQYGACASCTTTKGA